MEKKPQLNNELLAGKAFHWTAAFLGSIVFLYSLFNLPYSQLGLQFLVISLLTFTLGSRVAIDFQVFKSNISVADVFIYLTAILFGGETAAFLIAIEAYITSSRFTKRAELRMFNAGALTLSIFVAYKISGLLFGSVSELSREGVNYNLVFSLCCIVLSHYLINTCLMAISIAIRASRDVWSVWREYYVWIFIPFLASGSVALVAANAIHTSGFFAFVIILPIIGIIYFSYHTQQGKLQAITEKVEQSALHLQEMTESEERFRSAFSNAPIGMALVSSEGNWLQVNDALCKILGYKETEILAKKLHDVVYSEDLVGFLTQIGYVIQGKKESFQAELRYYNQKGGEIWTQTSISPLNDSPNSRLICQIQDITAKYKAEEKLRYDAFYDSLTGLANRNLLMQRLHNSINKSKESEANKFAIIFVDLDKFKLINDSIGHSIGDKLLVAVSQRLKKCVPYNSTLARFGSDEFLILLENEDTEVSKVTELVKDVQSQIGMGFVIAGHEINITASLGIVCQDEMPQTVEEVLRDADTALHFAKNCGRSQFIFFNQEMREKASHQMQLEKDLQLAIKRKELYLVFQPILDLQDKSLAGFESLIRWNHPKIGFVSPVEFIPLAEENGTIVQIGQFVLEESCRQLKEWQNKFGRELPITVSVNVSAKQLLQKQLFSQVVDILERHKIKPWQIKLEITESVVVENSELVISILRQFRALGVKLSMDDFGTGYSSLSYLHQMPINTLKIDRSFISQMTNEIESAEIVKIITLLAKNLSLDVVAEGIETEEQYAILRELKCEYGQGYLFAKPLSQADATDYIANSFESITNIIPPHNAFETQSRFLEH